jgi:hypothetical protein
MTALTAAQVSVIKAWFKSKGVPVKEVRVQDFDFGMETGMMIETSDGWANAIRAKTQNMVSKSRAGHFDVTIEAMCEALESSYRTRNNKRPVCNTPPDPETGRPGKAWEEIGAAWSVWKQMKNGSNSSQ